MFHHIDLVDVFDECYKLYLFELGVRTANDVEVKKAFGGPYHNKTHKATICKMGVEIAVKARMILDYNHTAVKKSIKPDGGGDAEDNDSFKESKQLIENVRQVMLSNRITLKDAMDKIIHSNNFTYQSGKFSITGEFTNGSPWAYEVGVDEFCLKISEAMIKIRRDPACNYYREWNDFMKQQNTVIKPS